MNENWKLQSWQLKQRQALPLEIKEKLSKQRIKEYYNHFNGNVYVSYSGGKDSQVLLHLVRQIYPEVEGVCVGTEPPENLELVKKTPNCKIIFPEQTMNEIIEKHGVPIISKEVSKIISRYRNTKKQKMKEYYLYGEKGKKLGVLPKKWRYLINAPFKISDKCCEICKKKPLDKYVKETKKHPIMGVLTEESNRRTKDYLKYGCNKLEGKNSRSHPISFWTEKDIHEYIKKYNLKTSNWYNMGYTRSGCFQCLYGIHLEKEPNRIQQMEKTHPAMYKHCIEKLGYDKILNYIGIPYTTKEKQTKLL